MGNRKVSFEEGRQYISAWGNENILKNHIAYFEKKLGKEIATYENEEIGVSLSHYPNFAVWIRLYSELICNSLYWRLLRSEGDWTRFEYTGFEAAKNMLFLKIDEKKPAFQKNINEHDIDRMKESFELILDLRHSFQHGGLPNLMRKLKYCKDPAKLDGMLNPNNYEVTKKIFLEAEELLKLLPQPPVAIGYS